MADVAYVVGTSLGCPALIVFHDTKNDRSFGGGFFMHRDLASRIGYKP